MVAERGRWGRTCDEKLVLLDPEALLDRGVVLGHGDALVCRQVPQLAGLVAASKEHLCAVVHEVCTKDWRTGTCHRLGLCVRADRLSTNTQTGTFFKPLPRRRTCVPPDWSTTQQRTFLSQELATRTLAVGDQDKLLMESVGGVLTTMSLLGLALLFWLPRF